MPESFFKNHGSVLEEKIKITQVMSKMHEEIYEMCVSKTFQTTTNYAWK